ncbi:MAG: DedA family protein [Desulfobacteraceae bacterium]|nr:DedA family protein [Desulfobacteraceae bacterium]
MFTAWVMRYGYIGISTLLMFGIVGLPVPDESLLMFAGYLVYKGEFRLLPTIAAVCLGSLCGITASYSLGRFGGALLARKFGRYLHLSEEKPGKAHEWFSRVGKWALFIGYFIPGIRHLTTYAAGMSRLEYPVFALFAYPGGALWSSGFVTAGFFLGRGWAETAVRIHKMAALGLGVALGLIAAILLIYWRKSRRRRS